MNIYTTKLSSERTASLNSNVSYKKDKNLEWTKTLIEIEDILIPHYEFDIWERGLYLYLLNQTRLRGIDSATIPLSSISVAFKILCQHRVIPKIVS